jgi:hypothetical protein
MRLRVQPKASGRAEVAGQPQGRIGADLTAVAHDVVDAVRRHLEVPRQLAAAQGQRLHEFLEQDLAGRCLDAHGAVLRQW